MDPVTHGLAGVVIARVGFSNSLGKWGPVIGGLVALAPDCDIVLRVLSQDTYLRYHRGITHSVILLPVYSFFLACILRRIFKKEGFIFFYLLCFLSLLSHIILDLMTSFGTMALSPFTDKRLSWDIVFIVDPWFTGSLLMPLLLAYFLKRFKKELVLLSLGLVVVYTGLCMFNHHSAIAEAYRLVKEKGITPYRIAAIPQPFSPFKWLLLIDTGNALHQSFIRVDKPAGSENNSKNMVWKKWPESPFIDRAVLLSGVKFYLWFARFPVVMEKVMSNGNHLVEFIDLRFDVSMKRIPFTYIVEFNSEGDVILGKFATINLNDAI